MSSHNIHYGEYKFNSLSVYKVKTSVLNPEEPKRKKASTGDPKTLQQNIARPQNTIVINQTSHVYFCSPLSHARSYTTAFNVVFIQSNEQKTVHLKTLCRMNFNLCRSTAT